VIWAVFAAHIAARLAYVGYVWVGLTRQQSDAWWTRRWGIAGGFARFRRWAALVMTIDALSFVAACLVAWGTLPDIVPGALGVAIGVVLVLLGVGTKLWAAATLGDKAYYWYNFFAPPRLHRVVLAGPYKFLENPMYTVGYLQAYGWALVTGSLPGLFAAAFLHFAILAFYFAVEKPHFQRLNGSRT